MLRRIGAVIFAVLVLLFAIGIRENRSVDRDEFSGDPDSAYDTFEDDSVDVLCVEELREVCQSDLSIFGFRVTVEPVWSTAARLADGGQLGAEAWLTFRPFDSLLRDPATPPPQVAASSPLVLTGPRLAIEALDAACPEDATRFACAAQRPASLILNDPENSALGVLALAVLAHSSGVAPDASAVIEPSLQTSLGATMRSARRSLSPALDAKRLGGERVALTLEADVVRTVDDEVNFDDRETFDEIGVRYPIDVRSAEIVLVGVPEFPRAADLAAVSTSREFGYSFSRLGFETAGRSFFLDDMTMFKDRPPVRTDLSFDLALLRELRGLA